MSTLGNESNRMQVFRSLEEIPESFGPTIAVIGNFDGVHLGHRQVLGAVREEARQIGARSVAITFDPHPQVFLRPDQAPLLIAPIPERLRLLAETGIDAVLILPFGQKLACLTARACVEDILIRKLGVRSMHEGANFRFGYRAEAGVAELAEFGREFGFRVIVHAPVLVRGLEVSSSAIREAIAAGDLRRARWMLGRSFSVASTPARGRGIGSKLLVPTVNLAPYSELLPAFGVYVTRLTIGQRGLPGGPESGEPKHCFQAVSNVGNRPTFGEASFAVESYMLDYDATNAPVELAEETPLRLEFLYRLRPEMTWPSPESLKAQIMKDVGRAKRYFRLIA